MTDRAKAAERALATHDAFDRHEDAFEAASTPFDATVRLEPAEGEIRYTVRVVVPTLDAVVAGESVADVVHAGWFETLDRRLEDVDGALRATVEPPTVDLDERAGTVTVTMGFESARPDQGADDAAALVGYVEGTYVEGVIPGYTYREPVSGLLEQAYNRSLPGVED